MEMTKRCWTKLGCAWHIGGFALSGFDESAKNDVIWDSVDTSVKRVIMAAI